MVKKALVSLCDENESGIPKSVAHYLQDPIQLFIAGSGSLDPLPWTSNPLPQASSTHGKERDSGDGLIPSQSDYPSAKEAIVQIKWQVNGIHNWAQYLRHILGIEAAGVADGDDGNGAAATNDDLHSTYDEHSDPTSRISDPLGRTTASKSKSSLAYYVSKIPHSADKKHMCIVCNKRFTRPSPLQTHTATRAKNVSNSPKLIKNHELIIYKP